MNKAKLEKELDQAFQELCTLLVDYDKQELIIESLKKVIAATYRLGKRRGFETIMNQIKKIKNEENHPDSPL